MRVLLVNGPPGAGKDEVAKTVKASGYRFLHEKFALPIRRATMAFFGFVSEEQMEAVKRLDPRVRRFMIGLSQKVAKPVFGAPYFGEQCARRVLESGVQSVVITDAGFQEEVDAFCETLRRELALTPLIQLWSVNRPGCTFAEDSREYARVSGEGTGMIEIPNYSGLEEYRETVRYYASRFFTQ